MPPPTRRATTATLLQSGPTEMLTENETDRREMERLGYYTIPYKPIVDALLLPSTIGIAVATSGAFTVFAADSILGDSSPEGLAEQRRMGTLLAWAAIVFSLATIFTFSLQALYSSPLICKILSEKIHYRVELRTKFEPWPSLDFMRYITAYFMVGTVFLALIMQVIAAALVAEAARAYVPARACQIVIVVFVLLIGFLWGTANVLEFQQARDRMEGNVPAASTVGQKENHFTTQGGF
ncbi:hypothetical protein FRC00_002177 [Tulasnella sp. 408]|nr:hypothetical protein FRC00_002177 [Tulasnella sp. 408]